jgi:Protein of unknown function (DUF1588)/Protein of unknown function (DUF1595)/Protein of unknown function (DUF1587)/Protein of unknown function (DUF1585)/Protein of unknown function (DUF1592)
LVWVLCAGAVVLGCTDDETPARPRPLVTVYRPEPLRRLSHVEYQNSLRDLLAPFGVEVGALDLPPDTVRSGLENDARALGASELLLARYEAASRELAASAVADDARLSLVLGCPRWETPTEIEACGASFVTTFGARAFRRPLLEDEVARFTSLFRTSAMQIDVRGAAELTMAAMLQAPAFLYRLELSPLASEGSPPEGAVISVPDHEMASRLSYALWQSMPDPLLLEAARADAMLVDFHRQWLDLDRILDPDHATRVGLSPWDGSTGDAPTWDATVQASAREEALRFVRLAMEEGTLAALFTSPEAEVDARMAALYGVPFSGASPEEWVRVTLPETERAGILTRVAVLASHAHPGYASPPIRGNFVLERVACAPLGSPPADADISQPMPDPGAGPRTNRQLFEARTAGAGCQACHRRLDGVGFGLENYDASGVFRTLDNTLPVDATGRISGLDIVADYVGAVELSSRLTESRQIERCYVRRVMEMVWGRGLDGADRGPFDRVEHRFSRSGGRIDELLVSIVTDESFVSRRAVAE